ncbi:MAG: hypothetical protein U9O55_04700 [Patescibacteria group bacterium]|nr:hypothetical protein [Patescibacteria group bacterium]
MERIIMFDEKEEQREKIEEISKEIFANVLKEILQKIDFSLFQNLFSMLNETGEEDDVSRKYITELFFQECKKVAPGVYHGTIAYVKEENKTATKFLEYLENAGSKCFSAMNGFCVDSLNVIPDCKNCFYKEICESKTKNI